MFAEETADFGEGQLLRVVAAEPKPVARLEPRQCASQRAPRQRQIALPIWIGRLCGDAERC